MRERVEREPTLEPRRRVAQIIGHVAVSNFVEDDRDDENNDREYKVDLHNRIFMIAYSGNGKSLSDKWKRLESWRRLLQPHSCYQIQPDRQGPQAAEFTKEAHFRS